MQSEQAQRTVESCDMSTENAAFFWVEEQKHVQLVMISQ